MSFTATSYAIVNTTDGTIAGIGQTTSDQPTLPGGSMVLSSDQYATVAAAETDGVQCRLIGGVVRLIPVATPAPVDLDAIKAAAYIQIDTAAEAVRDTFLTPGSGQALEYQQTSDDAERLLAALGLTPGPVAGWVAIRTAPPRAGTMQPAAAATPPTATPPDPADYPWLGAEQAALAAIGQNVSLLDIALSVHVQMESWSQIGSVIKEIRRTAKLQVSVSTTSAQISAILSALAWPQAPSTIGPG